MRPVPTYRPRITSNRGELTWEIDVTVGSIAEFISQHGCNSQNISAIAVFWGSLLVDSPTDLDKPRFVVSKFVKNFVANPIEVIKTLSSLYDRLVSGLTGHESEATIGPFIEEFKKTPVFREYLEFYKTRDPAILRYLSSFLLFGKKMYYEDPDFHEVSLRDWMELEQDMGEWAFPDNILNDLAEIVSWIFRDFDDHLFLPVHGSGSVAERGVRDIHEKNKLILLDVDLSSAFDRPDQIDPWSEEWAPSNQFETCRTSRLKFVPKDVGKSRTICMEPTTLQWTQQAVRLWVEQALASSLGNSIPLHDQSRNRMLALRGSLDGSLDTIDLSSASDSVHMELVRAIFPYDLLDYLEVTRSDKVDLGEGRIVEQHKFAPMGSALCFPIQSAIYAAIVIRSSLAWRHGKAAGDRVILSDQVVSAYLDSCYNRKLKDHLSPFSVFGDDIVCDSHITSIVIETLQSLNFRVNVSKSFMGKQSFRESCGGFYYLGSDVTPLRAKFGKIGASLPMSTLASLIDLANRALEYGYLTLRQHIIRQVLYYPIGGVKKRGLNPVLFSPDPDVSLALQTNRENQNGHLRTRLYDAQTPCKGSHYDLQRDEVRSLTVRPKNYISLTIEDEVYRRTAWWRSRLHGLSDKDIPMKIPANAGPGWRWTTTLGR